MHESFDIPPIDDNTSIKINGEMIDLQNPLFTPRNAKNENDKTDPLSQISDTQDNPRLK